jgi:hypothetical protein
LSDYLYHNCWAQARKMKIALQILIVSWILIGCKNQSDQEKEYTEKSINKSEYQDDKGYTHNVVQIQGLESEETSEESIKRKQEKGSLSINVSIEDISYKEIKFKSVKSKMSEIMGIPDSIIEPKYDCGPFSEDWQEMKFYQYFFKNMNFIVYKNIVEIQNISFVENEKLNINGKFINGEMTIEKVIEILGIENKEGKYEKNHIIIYPKESIDEHYILKFKENKLSLFDRYEPC